jgi:uncharacterized membrane protein
VDLTGKLKMKKLKLNLKLKKINWPKIQDMKKEAPLALLSYLHILVIIPLIFSKKSDFVKYHSRQGLMLLLFWILVGFSFYVPYLPWLLLIIIFVDILYGIIHVVLGKTRPMPLIGKMAEKMSI